MTDNLKTLVITKKGNITIYSIVNDLVLIEGYEYKSVIKNFRAINKYEWIIYTL